MFLYRYDVIYHEVWILQAKLELCPWMSGTESYKLYFNYEVHSLSILLDLLRHVMLIKHGWAPGDSWTWVPNPTLSTGLKVMLSNHYQPPGQVHLTENLTRSSQSLFTQKTNSEFNRNQVVSCMAQETDKDLEDPEDAKSQERNHRVVCGRPFLTALGAKKRQWKKEGIPEQSSSKVNMSQVSFSKYIRQRKQPAYIPQCKLQVTREMGHQEYQLEKVLTTWQVPVLKQCPAFSRT